MGLRGTILAVLMFAWCCPYACSAETQPLIRAGAVKVDITPPLPACYDLLQVATEVAHPLHARVLYLDDADDQVLLVAVDYEGILRTAYDTLRQAIAEATGVPRSRIVVNSNHSHNAPWVNLDLQELLAPHGLRQVDTEYFDDTVAEIAKAARQAKEKCRAVTISAGSAQLPEMAWNRRSGYARPEDVDRLNRERRYPIGVTDPTMGLVRFDDLQGNAVAVLSVYASHYVSAGSNKISSSYSGPAMDRIERELGNDCVSLFFQGCAGNVVPPPGFPNGSKENVEKAGELFAGRALPVLEKEMKRVDRGRFDFASKRVRLPLAPLREHGSIDSVRSMFAKPAVNASAHHRALTLSQLQQRFDEALKLYQEHQERPYVLNLTAYGDRLTLARRLDEWSDYDLQALRAGPLSLVILPGESFIEFALEIRRRAGCEFTFVAGYADMTPVYIPDETAFEEGGYEVGLWCYSTPQTGNVLVREAVDLLRAFD